MVLVGASIPSEVGLRLLLSPIGSNVVIRTACCTVGVAFPVYSTFKAIESKDRREQEKCLLYWAAYGSFSFVEMFSDKILYWIPFYYHLKFAFLVWLQLPPNSGSRQIYRKHLRPFLLRHQAKIDSLLNATSNEIGKFVSAHQQEILFLQALLGKCASAVNQVVKNIFHPAQLQAQNQNEDQNPPLRPQTEPAEPNSDE